MKILVSAERPELASKVDPRFGRAAYFVLYDTEDDSFKVIDNANNAGAAQGAGIQAAQLVAKRSPDVVVSGNIGPKAYEVLRGAGIQMVSWDGGTVGQAVELVRNGEFEFLGGATVREHWQ